MSTFALVSRFLPIGSEQAPDITKLQSSRSALILYIDCEPMACKESQNTKYLAHTDCYGRNRSTIQELSSPEWKPLLNFQCSAPSTFSESTTMPAPRSIAQCSACSGFLTTSGIPYGMVSTKFAFFYQLFSHVQQHSNTSVAP